MPPLRVEDGLRRTQRVVGQLTVHAHAAVSQVGGQALAELLRHAVTRRTKGHPTAGRVTLSHGAVVRKEVELATVDVNRLDRRCGVLQGPVN
jgi:hypothetical protein